MMKVDLRMAVAWGTLAFLNGCALESNDQWEHSEKTRAIVNGELASTDHIESTVGILFSNNTVCTSTLIAPNLVVTAAHCVCNGGATCAPLTAPGEATIIVGELNIKDQGVPAGSKISFSNVVNHSGYPPQSGSGVDHDDIAMIFLDRDVTEIPVAYIPTLEEFDAGMAVDNMLRITGYGETALYQSDTGVLRTAEVPFNSRTDTEFEAGVRNGTFDNPSVCRGDSGGPAYATINGVRSVVGVISRAPVGVNNCGDGAIYTLLPAYLDWLEDNSDGRYTHSTPPTGTLMIDHKSSYEKIVKSLSGYEFFVSTPKGLPTCFSVLRKMSAESSHRGESLHGRLDSFSVSIL